MKCENKWSIIGMNLSELLMVNVSLDNFSLFIYFVIDIFNAICKHFHTINLLCYLKIAKIDHFIEFWKIVVCDKLINNE